jgi:hypothetical protein
LRARSSDVELMSSDDDSMFSGPATRRGRPDGAAAAATRPSSGAACGERRMPRASGGLARRRSTLRSVNFFVDDFDVRMRG